MPLRSVVVGVMAAGLAAGALLLPIPFNRPACASDVNVLGGTLHVGSQLSLDRLGIGPSGRLTGAGSISGRVDIAGIVSPGYPDAWDSATLAIAGPVAFATGSVYLCYAATHTDIDRLAASGAVTGICEVSMSKSTTAIPVSQTIVSGAPAGDYTGFFLTPSCANDWQLAPNGSGALLVTDLRGDSDADGLPDWWELKYFSDRTIADPNAYSDADLLRNIQEYIAGTDPLDAKSVFQIVSIACLSTSQVVIAWSSASNRIYSVLRSTNVVTDSFAVLTSNLTARPPDNVYTDSVTRSGYYYRVRVSY